MNRDKEKEQLKEALTHCTKGQQDFFKKCFCKESMDLSLNDAVDAMPVGKVDWALANVERVVSSNAYHGVKVDK